MRTQISKWLEDNKDVPWAEIGPATLSEKGLVFEVAIEDKKVAFLFEGISGGTLSLEDASSVWTDEYWESVSVQNLSDADWAQYPRFSIYCTDVLKDPRAVESKLEEYLGNAHSFKTASDFLNMGALADLSKLTVPTFLLGTAPASISDLICEELTRQGVGFSVVDSRVDAPSEERVSAHLVGSHILCESAWAICE